MAQPDFGLLGQAPNINETVMNSLFGQQKLQQNQSVLDEQSRADAARVAQAKLVSDPAADDAQFEELLAPIALFNPAQAAQMRRQRQMQQESQEVFANPTPQNIGRFGMKYPEALKDMKDAWSVMDAGQRDAGVKASSDVYNYLRANDATGAIAVLQQHMDAASKTGEDVSNYPHLIDLIRQNPKGAQALAGLNLSLGIGDDKFASAYGKLGDEERAKEVQPFKVRQEAATAGIKETENQFAPAKAQSDLETEAAQRQRMADQTANEVADLAIKRDGLELDKDKLTSTIQLELEKLNSSQLDAGGRQAVNSAVGDAASSNALADRAEELAGKLVGQPMTSGWASTVRETGKGMWGSQDTVTALRNEYNRLINQQAIKNLPPGPASDKDIALAKQGFPPANAAPQVIHDFLQGMAKMQRQVAAASDRKANWIAGNGSLAPARRDVTVGGVQVPAGTTFNEFDRNAVKRGKAGELPTNLQSVISKYGGR